LLLRALAMRRPSTLCLLVALLALACQGEPPPPQSGTPPPPPALTEHRPAEFHGRPTKNVGEPCSTYGAAECVSSLCVHTSDRERPYVCSNACQVDTECPQKWRCIRPHPSAESSICIPGRGGNR